MLAFIKQRDGHKQRVFRLSTGLDIPFRGPFFSPPNPQTEYTAEINEISCPAITPDELEELAEDLKTLAAELRSQEHGITAVQSSSLVF